MNLFSLLVSAVTRRDQETCEPKGEIRPRHRVSQEADVVALDDEANQTWMDNPGPSQTPLSQLDDEDEIRRRREQVTRQIAELEPDEEA